MLTGKKLLAIRKEDDLSTAKTPVYKASCPRDFMPTKNGATRNKLSYINGINAVWAKQIPASIRRSFPKGRVLDIERDMRIGDRTGFYYIISGLIRLAYIGMGGEERTLLYAGEGVLLNVPSILTNDFGDSVATCMEKTEIAIFDANLLSDIDFARENPELMLNLIHTLSFHLVMHSQRLAETSLENTISRLCSIIQEMASENGPIKPNFTQQELALILGIHRATLTRALTRLRNMGVIGKFTKRELEILDPVLLGELAGKRSV